MPSRISNSLKNLKQRENTTELVRRLRIQSIKLLGQVAALKIQVSQARSEQAELSTRINELTEFKNALSGALGSCSECWGENAGCENCRGNGSPGWKKVNRRLFNIYILPTLERTYGLRGNINLNRQ